MVRPCKAGTHHKLLQLHPNPLCYTTCSAVFMPYGNMLNTLLLQVHIAGRGKILGHDQRRAGDLPAENANSEPKKLKTSLRKSLQSRGCVDMNKSKFSKPSLKPKTIKALGAIPLCRCEQQNRLLSNSTWKAEGMNPQPKTLTPFTPLM